MSHSFFIFCLEHISSFRKAFLFFSMLRFCRSPSSFCYSSFYILHSSFLYLPLYVVVALAEVVWEPPFTLAPRVSPYQVSSVSVMVGEE